MIADLVQQIAEAAIVEARTVPKLLVRDDDLYWRAADGRMVLMTDAVRMAPVCFLETP